jgi:hypothetical protein
MGATKNIRLAGDARRRQLEGLAQRRAAAGATPSTAGGPSDNPAVTGARAAMSPNAVMRQEMYAARPGVRSPLQTQGIEFSQGLISDPSQLANISAGSPGFEQIQERVRGLAKLRNTGSRF